MIRSVAVGFLDDGESLTDTADGGHTFTLTLSGPAAQQLLCRVSPDTAPALQAELAGVGPLALISVTGTVPPYSPGTTPCLGVDTLLVQKPAPRLARLGPRDEIRQHTRGPATYTVFTSPSGGVCVWTASGTLVGTSARGALAIDALISAWESRSSTN
jgi:hypothetical protein